MSGFFFLNLLDGCFWYWCFWMGGVLVGLDCGWDGIDWVNGGLDIRLRDMDGYTDKARIPDHGVFNR